MTDFSLQLLHFQLATPCNRVCIPFTMVTRYVGNWNEKWKSEQEFHIFHLSFGPAMTQQSTLGVASYPGSRWAGKERAWYTLFAHAFNLPKIWGLRGIF